MSFIRFMYCLLFAYTDTYIADWVLYNIHKE